MSLAAVPVFLWGRSLVSTRWALVAAALTLALPGLVYSGLVMTEVLFYPLLVLAAWAMARAIERPTPARQAAGDRAAARVRDRARPRLAPRALAAAADPARPLPGRDGAARRGLARL